MKVKKRLVSQPTASTQQLVDTSSTTTTTTTTTINRNSDDSSDEFLSPEDWLERFYNGKNLLKSKQKLKTKQKQQGKFENFPNLRTVDKEDVTDTVPETPLGLFFLKILSS